MSASSSLPLNPNAPEFSPLVTQTPPYPHHHPYYFYLPLIHYYNPLQYCSGFVSKPPEPSAAGGEKLRSFRLPTLGFRFQPPRLKKSKLPREDEITIRLAGRTSLMIKNIPNSLGRKDLLKILDDHCREKNVQARSVSDEISSSYDFLYLPMDFVKCANLGYAFVNFTTSPAAVRFFQDFDKFHWRVPGNKKTSEITLAKYQGKEELSRRFNRSTFACHTDAYLPVVLSPPSDGFVRYRLTLLGARVGPRGGACITPPSIRQHQKK